MDERKKQTDEALARLEEAFREYPYDGDKLESLFEQLMFQLEDTVAGLDAGMTPLLSGESPAARARVGRHNLQILYLRLKQFRDNGYREAASIPNRDYVNRVDMACNDLRRQVEDMSLSDRARAEIVDQIDQLQEMGRAGSPRAVRWNQLRPVMVWLSGKPVEIGGLLLPLLVLILKGDVDD